MSLGRIAKKEGGGRQGIVQVHGCGQHHSSLELRQPVEYLMANQSPGSHLGIFCWLSHPRDRVLLSDAGDALRVEVHVHGPAVGAVGRDDKWPSDPEEIGVDMATKSHLTPKERENYEFWENVKKNGWQVCAGAFERGTQVEPSHVEVLNRWSLRLAYLPSSEIHTAADLLATHADANTDDVHIRVGQAHLGLLDLCPVT